MQIILTDREDQTLMVALELLRQHMLILAVAPAAVTAEPSVSSSLETPAKINEYDILDRKHTLMHVVALMSKISGKPHTTFMNPQPSQTLPRGADAA
jgi:hypothetical protein